MIIRPYKEPVVNRETKADFYETIKITDRIKTTIAKKTFSQGFLAGVQGTKTDGMAFHMVKITLRKIRILLKKKLSRKSRINALPSSAHPMNCERFACRCQPGGYPDADDTETIRMVPLQDYQLWSEKNQSNWRRLKW